MEPDPNPGAVDAVDAVVFSLVSLAVVVTIIGTTVAVVEVARALAARLIVSDAAALLPAMNLLVAAQSGWGKSFKSQHVMEQNIPEYDRVVVLDFCDEYRGLVKAGMADWWIVGPREREWSASTWSDFLDANEKVVLARHDLVDVEEWRQVANTVIGEARRHGDVLVVVDEAHFVAPQQGKLPSEVKGLATTGRGEGASSVFITQRLAEADKTVISQCQARLLGGFESKADLRAVDKVAEYPVDLHNHTMRERIAGLPDDLKPDDRETPESLQKHKDGDDVVGSEWVYSDDSGDRERRNTRGLADEMATTHYGNQGNPLKV